MVYVDPLCRACAMLRGQAGDDRGTAARRRESIARRLTDVPVCYGGAYGPDLADLAAFAGCADRRRDRAALRTRVPRLCRRLRPGFRLHGDRRSAHCGATSRLAARQVRLDRSRSRRARPVSIRPRRREAGTSSAARRCGPTIRRARRRSCFTRVIGCASTGSRSASMPRPARGEMCM